MAKANLEKEAFDSWFKEETDSAHRNGQSVPFWPAREAWQASATRQHLYIAYLQQCIDSLEAALAAEGGVTAEFTPTNWAKDEAQFWESEETSNG